MAEGSNGWEFSAKSYTWRREVTGSSLSVQYNPEKDLWCAFYTDPEDKFDEDNRYCGHQEFPVGAYSTKLQAQQAAERAYKQCLHRIIKEIG